MLDLYLHLNYEWDAENEKLFKVVTAIGAPDATGKRSVRNNGALKYDDLILMIDKRRRWPRTDIYIAMGVFAKASNGMSKDGFPFINRDVPNAVSLKSLYIDVDVGADKGYPSTADAEAALQKFLFDSGMPEPTMVVRSGSGGFHVYWGFDKPLPVAQWKPLAEALKACATHHKFRIDPAVTADAARILRVPTTLNYKHPTATLVSLDNPGAIRLYTADGIGKVLAPFVNAAPQGTAPGAKASPWGQNFTANATTPMPKLDIDRIAVVCPAIADTLATGGAGQSEPEWANYMFTAAWTLDPVNAAHRLSSGHKDYKVPDTDRKLAEKQAAIANNPQLGWPLCASFNHVACKTCPLLVIGKSPIHFAHSTPPGSTHSPQPAYPAGDPLMPEGYWRNKDNHVFTNTQYGPTDVFAYYPIIDGGMDTTPDGQQALVLQTHISGRDRYGPVSLGKQHPQGMAEALFKGAHIAVRPENQKVVRDFVMAWVSHLQKTHKTIRPASFGWSGDSFVFGDESFTPNGPEVIYRGTTVDDKFQRVGSQQPWTDAMKLVYGNPHLEVLTATAFAAPLVQLACDSSLVLSIYSYQSGVGKSTAMKLAQSVWGHPRTGMSMLDDTRNAFMKKITDLNNLPIYWDELKTKDQVEEVVKLVFATTQGRSKSRLSRDSSSMPVGMSTTMFAIASNHGIADQVTRTTEGTEAGGLRVFEMQAGPLVSSHPSNYGEQLIIPLNSNYGVVGALYADFIVRNKATVRQVLTAIADKLADCSFTQKERFWDNTMTTVLAGAYLANTAGLATFDVALIEACLRTTLAGLRDSSTAKIYSMSGAQSGEDLLAEMMTDLRGKNLVVTEAVPTAGMGRPAPGTVVADPYTDPARLQDVWMQYGKNDGRVLARVRPFNEWLWKRGQHPKQMLELLRQDYVVTERKTSIGVGVAFLDAIKGRAMCYDLTPKVPPAPPSHNPSSPSSNFGSPVQ
jgi:hypothetical protein